MKYVSCVNKIFFLLVSIVQYLLYNLIPNKMALPNEGEIIVTTSILIIIIFVYAFYYAITINLENKNKK